MTTTERYHGFDALRGAMMLLGVAIHSGAAYVSFDGVWWMKDPYTSKGIEALVLFIHTFRLPAFFVMSGFFAALLVEKRGWQGFVENRMARLALPFVLGLLFLLPFLKAFSVFAYYSSREADPLSATIAWFQRGRLSQSLEPMHLWFLLTLMWVCLLAVVFRRPLAALKARWFGELMSSRWGILACASLTFPTLLLTEFGILDSAKGFTPNWHVVAAYSVFFSFGWGMYLHRDQIHRLRRFGAAEMLVALALLPPAVITITNQLAQRGTRIWWAYAVTAALTALSAWLMIYGLTGFFLRRLNAPAPWSRYLADSAYWVYVMHPAALVIVQVPMMGLDWNPWIKFTIGIVFAVPLLFLTYDRFARSTWIGVVLNGRRYERGLPERSTGTPAAAETLLS